MTINIDLNDLTQAHLDDAMLSFGKTCMYASPCIIGTLVPQDQREAMDMHRDSTMIQEFINRGDVIFPNKRQEEDANLLQEAYDYRDKEKLFELAHKYIKA